MAAATAGALSTPSSGLRSVSPASGSVHLCFIGSSANGRDDTAQSECPTVSYEARRSLRRKFLRTRQRSERAILAQTLLTTDEGDRIGCGAGGRNWPFATGDILMASPRFRGICGYGLAPARL